MTEELTISGHANEWVALVDNKVFAAKKSFAELVKLLETEKIMKKATLTHVSGNHNIL